MTRGLASAPLRPSLRNATLLLLLLAAAGCASTRGPAIDRSAYWNVQVRESHAGLGAETAGTLPEHAITGLLGGALAGLAAGIFVPYTWFVGGPILTTPLLAARQAACGKAVAEAGEVPVKLKKIAADVDIGIFRNAMDARLQAMKPAAADGAAGPVATAAPEKILDITELAISLSDAPGEGDMFTTDACRPALSARASWRIVNAVDGRLLEERSSDCRLPASAETFKEWFANGAQRRIEVAALLDCLGQQLAYDLTSDHSRSCDYELTDAVAVRDNARPSVPYSCAANRRQRALDDADRGPQAQDEFVNCSANGKRQWTSRSKCD